MMHQRTHRSSPCKKLGAYKQILTISLGTWAIVLAIISLTSVYRDSRRMMPDAEGLTLASATNAIINAEIAARLPSLREQQNAVTALLAENKCAYLVCNSCNDEAAHYLDDQLRCKKRVDYFVHNDKQNTCKWDGWDGIKESSPKIFCTGCRMYNCGGKDGEWHCRFVPRCPKCDCFVKSTSLDAIWPNIGRTKQCPGTKWISVCNGNGRPTKNGKFFGWNLTEYSICSNKKHRRTLRKCNKAFCKWLCRRCNGTGKSDRLGHYGEPLGDTLRISNRMVEEKLAAVEKKVNANGH